jgi:hypothetical protein
LSDTISIELITAQPHRSHGGKRKKNKVAVEFSHQYVAQRFQETEEKFTQSKAFLSDEHLRPAMGLPRPHDVTKSTMRRAIFILGLMI